MTPCSNLNACNLHASACVLVFLSQDCEFRDRFNTPDTELLLSYCWFNAHCVVDNSVDSITLPPCNLSKSSRPHVQHGRQRQPNSPVRLLGQLENPPSYRYSSGDIVGGDRVLDCRYCRISLVSWQLAFVTLWAVC